MKKWFALLLTLLLLAILSYFCFINKSNNIKNDLLSKAKFAYSDMRWVKVAGMQGNNLTQTRILILEGIAKNQEERSKAENIAKNIEGIDGVKNNISILYKESDFQKETFISQKKKPIYKISVSKKKEHKVVVIKGVAPNKETHNQLIDYAKKLFGEVNIIDEIEEKEGTPYGWVSAIRLGLEKLKTVQYGHFEMINNKFNFTGYTAKQKDKSKLLTSFHKNLDKNYVGNYTIHTPKIEALCQTKINHLLANNKIYFQQNKANIKKESYKLLNNLAETMQKNCLEDVIVIEGHTDSNGKKSYNLKLSTKRANSVKNYLIKQGVKAMRIETIGYGESRPIASNETQNGKKRNRRIEFKIKTLK